MTALALAGHRRLALGAALLLSVAGPAGAEDRAPRLELYYGPNQTTQVTLESVKAELDGRPLPVEKPAPAATPGQPFYTGPLPPGTHQLDVSVTMVGDSAVFRYLTDYRFAMRGRLEFASAAEGVVQATLRITDRLSPNVEWFDRYGLSLSAVRKVPPPSPRPERAAPAAAPPALATPVAASATCALAPLHFKFMRADLSAQARGALDRFAACLAGTGSRVTLVGHCDRRGSDEVNQRLGTRRAEAAARYLVDRGIAAARLDVESRGADAPLCVEATAACHARNRRVVATDAGAP
jgi:outer membrane protein OmpA-like peptidoglycan-associated protein